MAEPADLEVVERADALREDGWSSPTATLMFETLLPAPPNGRSRRSGKVTNGDESVQATVKRIWDESTDAYLVQIRVWQAGETPAWTQVVIDESGSIVAYAVGNTERDSWNAASDQLRAKGLIS